MTSKKSSLPSGVRVSRRKVQGRRESVRGTLYGRSRHVVARWPLDGLAAARIPLLLCVAGGKADLRFGQYILHCEKGSCIVVPPGVPFPNQPGVPHLEPEHRDDGWCDLLWLCAWSVMSGVQCWLSQSRGHFSPLAIDDGGCSMLDTRVAQYFHSLINEAIACREEKQAPDQVIVSGLLTTVLGAVQREIREGRAFFSGSHKPVMLPGNNDESDIGQARAYIAAHLATPLTIESVARSVYMSRTQFACRFRAETGKTFTAYLTELRLAEAKRLLAETQWSVEAIGKMVGFKSSSHLRELMHRHEGVSPLEFRRARQSR